MLTRARTLKRAASVRPAPPPAPEALEDWDPEALFARAAARAGLSVEQFRQRLRQVAAEAAQSPFHVCFESARDLEFSDQELAHLNSGCSFCERLVQTLHPTQEAIEPWAVLPSGNA